jgi:hypothetical protein
LGCPVGGLSFLLLQVEVAIECWKRKGKRGIDAAIDDALPGLGLAYIQGSQK